MIKVCILKLEKIIPYVLIGLFLYWFFGNTLANLTSTGWDKEGGGDAIFSAVVIKSILENGLFVNNPRMGTPFSSNQMDFPGSDGINYAIVWGLSLITDDPIIVINILYIIGFILTYFTSYWVLRRLDFDILWSAVGGVVFTCLPYHFLRGMDHIFLSNYYSVPIWIYISIHVYDIHCKNKFLKNVITLPSLLLATFAATSGGLYYAFFGVFFILISTILSSFENKKIDSIYLFLKILSVTLATILINVIPNIVFWVGNGLNQAMAQRHLIESDLYGLRISQLLLPIWGHNSVILSRFSRGYHDALRPITEAASSGMGIISAIGFLILIISLFVNAKTFNSNILFLLSRFNIASILLATVGGGGVLFAMLVTPQFRGLNRISVFIAFISLLALFYFAKHVALVNNIFKFKRFYLKYLIGLALVFIVLYDQVPNGARPNGETNVRNDNYGRFISKIEDVISEGGMIYTMPYIHFPEAAPLNNEGYNSMMRPYFYSNHARWSYGAVKGRIGDFWLKELEMMPLEKRLDVLRATGFEGIYVDKSAYIDHGASIKNDLIGYLGEKFIESDDGNYVFFNLRMLKSDFNLSHSAFISGRHYKNFYNNEIDGDYNWNWSSGDGVYVIFNFSQSDVSVIFSAGFDSLDKKYLNVFKDGIVLSRIEIGGGAKFFKIPIDLRPGINYVSMTTESDPVKIPSDPRKLSFKLINPQIVVR